MGFPPPVSAKKLEAQLALIERRRQMLMQGFQNAPVISTASANAGGLFASVRHFSHAGLANRQCEGCGARAWTGDRCDYCGGLQPSSVIGHVAPLWG